jgi:hypothetical protein
VAERAGVALLALAVAALLAVSLTAARAGDRLSELQFHTPHPTRADLAEADRLAATAGRLTAGERRTQLVAQIRLRAGDAAGASTLLRGAVAREPENAEAWLLLSEAAARTDPALARRAAQRVRELVPPVPAP